MVMTLERTKHHAIWFSLLIFTPFPPKKAREIKIKFVVYPSKLTKNKAFSP